MNDRLLPRGIRGRLILILLIVVIPILLAQVALYYRRFEVRVEQESRANLDVARAVAVAFDAYIGGLVRQELAIGLSLTRPPLPLDEANHNLAVNASVYLSVREFSWQDPQGYVIASSNPQVIGAYGGDREHFRAIFRGQEWAVGDLLLARVGGEPVFAIARGIRDEQGTLQGVVVATVDPRRLGDLSLPLERAAGGAFRIIDRNGMLVYRRPEVELTWEQRMLLPEDRLVAQALGGEEVTGTFFSPIDQQERIAALTPVRSTGWIVSAGVLRQQAIAPIVQDIIADAALLLLIAGVSSLVAVVVSRTITAPIGRLKEQAITLSRGEYGRRAETAGPREMEELAGAFNLMAGEIRQREEELRQAESELRQARDELEIRVEQRTALAQRRAAELQAVLDNMVDGVYVCDVEGRIALVNEAGLRLLAMSTAEEAKPRLEEMVERLHIRHLDGRAMSPEEMPLARALSDEIVAYQDQVITDLQTGRDRYIRTSAGPIRDEEGRIVGAVAVARDVTELTELDRLKDQFVDVAAHELKTPVTGIRGFAQYLIQREHEGLSPQGLRALQAINRQTDRIGRIVDDLLDISRLQLGRLELQMGSIDLPAFVEEVVDRMELTIAKHAIRVVRAEPVVIQGDRDRLEQVLTNLLDNAIKYSPQGGDVEVSLAKTDDEATVSVRDYGIGIPEEKQPGIFERFYRAHTGTPFDYGGMGVGLYISNEIVKRHGGRMWFESEEEKGSTFYFSLPVA